MAVRSLYLHNGNSCAGRTSLYRISPKAFICSHISIDSNIFGKFYRECKKTISTQFGHTNIWWLGEKWGLLHPKPTLHNMRQSDNMGRIWYSVVSLVIIQLNKKPHKFCIESSCWTPCYRNIHEGHLISAMWKDIPRTATQYFLMLWIQLTHWGRVTHICVGNLTIIGSDNGLSPGRRQAITWTNVGILLIGPLGTNFSEMLIEIHTFSFKKIHLKMSSGKWRPFCLGLNVLTVPWVLISYMYTDDICGLNMYEYAWILISPTDSFQILGC